MGARAAVAAAKQRALEGSHNPQVQQSNGVELHEEGV